jgi:hypothetical protein
MSKQTWYRKVVVLDREHHGGLKFDDNPDLGFVAEEVALPIGVQELGPASLCYPIVFSLGEQPIPLAVMGLREGENLFVTAARKWLAGAYIPAVVRNYPFVVIDAGENGQLVGLDTESNLVGEDRSGAALFDGDDLSDAGRFRVGLCAAYRDSMRQTAEFGRALAAAGVLAPQDVQLVLPGSADRLKLRGYAVVHPHVFGKLDDATLVEWRRKGWLEALAYHMASVGQWQRLITMAGARPAQPLASATAGDEGGHGNAPRTQKRRTRNAKTPTA